MGESSRWSCSPSLGDADAVCTISYHLGVKYDLAELRVGNCECKSNVLRITTALASFLHAINSSQARRTKQRYSPFSLWILVNKRVSAPFCIRHEILQRARTAVCFSTLWRLWPNAVCPYFERFRSVIAQACRFVASHISPPLARRKT